MTSAVFREVFSIKHETRILFLCMLRFLVILISLNRFGKQTDKPGLLFRMYSFRRVHAPLIHVKIKITFIIASSYRALPFKCDAAHVTVNTVVA